MRAIQIYETSLRACDSDHFFHAVVVPRQSLPRRSGKSRCNSREIRNKLGLKRVKGVTTDGSNLVLHLAILLSDIVPTDGDERQDRLGALQNLRTESTVAGQRSERSPFKPTLQDERFAQQVAFDRIIPIEQSVLSRESLATLVMRAVRKRKHFVEVTKYVTDGDDEYPILLLSVPESIILCGDGDALKYALDAEVRDQLFSWLAGDRFN